MEPPDMIDAVFNLRRSCKTATELELEASTLFSSTVSEPVSVISDYSECQTQV